MKPSPEVIAAAQAAERTWRIPTSVSLAQAILESGWFRHMPPGSNNPFGIKAVGGQNAVNAPTKEFLHARWVTEEQPFAKFSSLAVAFDVHGRLLATSPYYAKARAALPDPYAFADALTGVYATDPTYGRELGAVIKDDDLTQYDRPLEAGAARLAATQLS